MIRKNIEFFFNILCSFSFNFLHIACIAALIILCTSGRRFTVKWCAWYSQTTTYDNVHVRTILNYIIHETSRNLFAGKKMYKKSDISYSCNPFFMTIYWSRRLHHNVIIRNNNVMIYFSPLLTLFSVLFHSLWSYAMIRKYNETLVQKTAALHCSFL